MQDQISEDTGTISALVEESETPTMNSSLVQRDTLWLNTEDLGKISGHMRVCNVTKLTGMCLYEDFYFLHFTPDSSTFHEKFLAWTVQFINSQIT